MSMVEGAQSVSRAVAALRAVSAAMPRGISTADVARTAGLSRATAQRLLAALTDEGMVDRDGMLGRWLLGPEVYLMGTLAAERYDVRPEARDAVHALASATGESAFLSARRGEETVCLLREDGSFPLRSHVLYEGIRFPLGVASAGLVILSHLEPHEIDAYIDRRGADLESRYGSAHSPKAIRRSVAGTRRRGYAINPGLLVPGTWGMGAAVFDSSGTPAWALSVTGVETRFPADRRRDIGALLLEHAHALGRRLARG